MPQVVVLDLPLSEALWEALLALLPELNAQNLPGNPGLSHPRLRSNTVWSYATLAISDVRRTGPRHPGQTFQMWEI